MRDRRLVSTLSVTPIAEIRKMGVNATWMRCAMSTDWTVYGVKLPTASSLLRVMPRDPTLPLDPAEVPGRENHEPKRDSVPGESLEIVAADIAYQGAHGERRAYEGCDRTDPDDREIIDFDGVARFEEFQHRRAEYGRYRQEKRKLGGGRPGKSAQQAAHDRCTRARRAG